MARPAAIDHNTIPSSDFTCADWAIWHEALKKRHNKSTANSLTLKAYQKFGDYGCKFDEGMVRYFKRQGIDVEDWFSKSVTWSKDVTSDIGKIVRTPLQLSKWITPIVVIGGLVLVGWILYKVVRESDLGVDAGEVVGAAAAARGGRIK